jgi:K+-sensing histidine kinase KdpD
MVAIHPDDEEVASAARIAGSAGRAASSRDVVYVPDLQTGDERPTTPPPPTLSAREGDARSELAVPMLCLGDLIGVVHLDATTPRAFTQDDVRLVEGLAAQMAAAVESARRAEQFLDLERAKTDFIARVSHELRTPLAILQGFLETLVLHGERLSEECRQDALERARHASYRLGDLVEEMLALSSQQAGVLRPAIRLLELAPVLEEARAASLAPTEVTISSPPGVTIRSDGPTIRRIVGLLLNNAIAYAGSAELIVEQSRMETRVLVRDQGPGVPDHLGERVFERFVRGTDEPHGLGLGLSQGRTLATTIGAQLELLREARHGATFALVLPIEPGR